MAVARPWPSPGRCWISPRADPPAVGRAQVDAQLDTAAVTVPVDGSPPLDPAPTARERELLGYQPTRMTNEEIADRLGISVNTIKSHARALHRKLEVPNRREVVRRAEQTDLI